MKNLLSCTVWIAAVAGLLYLVIAPENGLIYSGPHTVAGLGLIGLGLCRMTRKKPTPATVKA